MYKFGVCVLCCYLSVCCSAYAQQMLNQHEYVDLGLSVMWAVTNLGSDMPSENGDYYQWGATTPNKILSQVGNYVDPKLSKKGKASIAPDSGADVVRKQWGSQWRMPTKAEFQELLSNCRFQWVTIKGHAGYKATSKRNGKSIFFPAGGYVERGTKGGYPKTAGNYWTATAHGDNEAYKFYFDNNTWTTPSPCQLKLDGRVGKSVFDGSNVFYGYNIRPVFGSIPSENK